jgi:hypothetical protein
MCRTIAAGASVAIISFRPALAQETDVDPAMMCDAAASAYQHTRSTTTIPTWTPQTPG